MGVQVNECRGAVKFFTNDAKSQRSSTGPFPAGKPVIQSEGLNARGAKNPLPMECNNWIGKSRIDKMENMFACIQLNFVLLFVD